MKKNVFKLNVSQELLMFTAIGISSHENDYRLSWSLNEHLGLQFVFQSKGHIAGTEEFACFCHTDETQTLWLISNRCSNGFLLPKYKNFDFILKFDRKLSENDLNSWLQDLKKAPLISALLPLPVERQIFARLS
ncbi:MAG: IPExxxVDY family protein [Bacteroidales bacterium]|jgi:hypothetical protein|nr:IPExxxVDY family protein [Bacteroidales bacterium]